MELKRRCREQLDDDELVHNSVIGTLAHRPSPLFHAPVIWLLALGLLPQYAGF